MGKGDKKSKKGKLVIGSYGVRRPRPSVLRKAASAIALSNKTEKPAKAVKAESGEKKPRPAAKKTAAKKVKD